MPREAELFENARGSVVEGYLLLKQSGGNIPRSWIDRAQESRRKRHRDVVRALKNKEYGLAEGIRTLRDWELAFEKESFYRGIRILMELERKGKTDL